MKNLPEAEGESSHAKQHTNDKHSNAKEYELEESRVIATESKDKDRNNQRQASKEYELEESKVIATKAKDIDKNNQQQASKKYQLDEQKISTG